MKLSLILEAIDRWSKPAKDVMSSTADLTAETGKLDRAAEGAAQATSELTGATGKLDRAAIAAATTTGTLAGTATGLDHATGSASKSVTALDAATSKLDHAAKTAAGAMGTEAGEAGKLEQAVEQATRATGALAGAADKADKKLSLLDRAFQHTLLDVARFAPVSDRTAGRIRRFATDMEYTERVSRRIGLSIRRGITDDFRRLSDAADTAKAKLVGFGKEAAIAGAGKVARAAAWGIGGTAAAGIAGGVGFLTDMMRKASQFEQMQVQLETTLGSAQKAAEAMTFIRKFAKDTPYELAEVTKAFVVAKQQGIDPFHGAMTIMGDAAGGLNKDLVDTILAVGDASRFQFERLIDTGITSSQKSGMVTLGYVDKTGKQITKTVRKNTLEVQKAVLGIYAAQFAGGMKRQSNTLGGILCNLSDQITNFELSVAGKGIFERVKTSLQNSLDWLNDAKNQKQIEIWADRTGQYLNKLWDESQRFIKETDWKQVADDIRGVGGAVKDLVEDLRALNAMGESARTFLNGIVPAPSKNGGLLGNPAKRFGQAVQGKDGGWRGLLGDDLKAWVPSDRFHVLPWNWERPKPAAPKAQPGHAKIALTITTDRGTAVRPTKIAATGLDVQVDTARAMESIA
jgi:hypothetical protein